MSNLVLYRKYRPGNFSDIVGQDHVVKTLMGALVTGRVAHGYLFSGPRGTGKTTIARLLAKAVNCENRQEKEYEPCNECRSCKEFSGLSAMDLIEIDAASNRGIDEIRELRDGIMFVPTRAKFKVFIIDEVHMLTREAFNALLKTLEEPPGHAIFVLATTEIEKIPPTILSRVQKFDFRRLSGEEIVGRLQQLVRREKIKADEHALRIVAQSAEGSMRDAESLLGQLMSFQEGEIGAAEVEEMLGVVSFKTVNDFMNFLADGKAADAVDFINGVNEAGYDLREFNKAAINYARRLALLKIDASLEKIVSKEITQDQLEMIKAVAEKMTLASARHLLNHFIESAELMKKTHHLALPLEIAAVSFIEEKREKNVNV